ncbi:response regulator [candidate division WWE3 bacterium]|nr:response regulator [candidate division WWE3 bacterium]
MDNGQPQTQPKQILFIEDDLLLRDIYSRSLTKAGFNVVMAEDGVIGLEKADDQPFDLILLDVMMPKMHGIDVLKHLKMNVKTKDIPVLMMTNLGQESVLEEAFGLGAIGFLIKAKLLPPELSQNLKTYFETGQMPINIKSI